MRSNLLFRTNVRFYREICVLFSPVDYISCIFLTGIVFVISRITVFSAIFTYNAIFQYISPTALSFWIDNYCFFSTRKYRRQTFYNGVYYREFSVGIFCLIEAHTNGKTMQALVLYHMFFAFVCLLMYVWWGGVFLS